MLQCSSFCAAEIDRTGRPPSLGTACRRCTSNDQAACPVQALPVQGGIPPRAGGVLHVREEQQLRTSCDATPGLLCTSRASLPLAWVPVPGLLPPTTATLTRASRRSPPSAGGCACSWQSWREFLERLRLTGDIRMRRAQAALTALALRCH